ncbi:hypothetical protein I4F81_011001 [Pyropia yezoensis]|uniref:Uncharacterized protein n=1 Tax=Pyropia yezoensis TaxID=2788 RepID=A0ACC3CE73_PYRYE|nr:hypothetical protein I4F81_011001 [Neopyropia yezoensis]
MRARRRRPCRERRHRATLGVFCPRRHLRRALRRGLCPSCCRHSPRAGSFEAEAPSHPYRRPRVGVLRRGRLPCRRARPLPRDRGGRCVVTDTGGGGSGQPPLPSPPTAAGGGGRSSHRRAATDAAAAAAAMAVVAAVAAPARVDHRSRRAPSSTPTPRGRATVVVVTVAMTGG